MQGNAQDILLKQVAHYLFGMTHDGKKKIVGEGGVRERKYIEKKDKRVMPNHEHWLSIGMQSGIQFLV